MIFNTNIATSGGGGGGGASYVSHIGVLESNLWSNGEQTIPVPGVTADSDVIVSAAPTQIADYAAAEIYCSDQGANYLTFTYLASSAPSTSIGVNILSFTGATLII